MVVTIKHQASPDLEVYGAVSKFEVHFHDLQNLLGSATGVMGFGIKVINVSLLKCDGEWHHVTNVEKLLVEEA